jgi:hypothetical protein
MVDLSLIYQLDIAAMSQLIAYDIIMYLAGFVGAYSVGAHKWTWWFVALAFAVLLVIQLAKMVMAENVSEIAKMLTCTFCVCVCACVFVCVCVCVCVLCVCGAYLVCTQSHSTSDRSSLINTRTHIHRHRHRHHLRVPAHVASGFRGHRRTGPVPGGIKRTHTNTNTNAHAHAHIPGNPGNVRACVCVRMWPSYAFICSFFF